MSKFQVRDDGTLVVNRGDNLVQFIPPFHVALVRKGLLSGKSFAIASPLYDIDRETAAFILGGGMAKKNAGKP